MKVAVGGKVGGTLEKKDFIFLGVKCNYRLAIKTQLKGHLLKKKKFIRLDEPTYRLAIAAFFRNATIGHL